MTVIKPFNTISVRFVALFFVFLFAGMGCTASLNIPPVSGTIRGPEGFDFENHNLALYWECIEGSFDLMSPTGSQPCGGFGSKSWMMPACATCP